MGLHYKLYFCTGTDSTPPSTDLEQLVGFGSIRAEASTNPSLFVTDTEKISMVPGQG